jgi:hypothetical protein
MKKKPFVIRCNPAPFAPKAERYVKCLQSKRIVSTRWIDNARGFESREEAHAFIEKISFELPRLSLSVANRNEIKALMKLKLILESNENLAIEVNRIIASEVK